MTGSVAAWNEFWHRPRWSTGLGLFRILFALCLYQEVSTTLSKSVSAVAGRFHLSYVDWIQPVSASTYEFLHALQYPLIALIAVGVFTRTALVGLLALQGYVFLADPLNFRNHPYFFLLVTGLLVLGPAADAFSLDSILAGRREGFDRFFGSLRPPTAQRLIQAQISIAYVWAAIHKLHLYYLEGHVLGDLLADDLPLRTSGELLAMLSPNAAAATVAVITVPWVAATLSIGTVLTELFLAVGLWFRRTRWVAIGIGVMFHLAILLVMEIKVFSIAMIASYLLFLDEDRVHAVVTRIVGRAD